MQITGHKTEDELQVVLTFRTDEDVDISKLTIYKTIPVSYKYEPSALKAIEVVAPSWQDFLSDFETDANITWTQEALV